MMSRLTNAIGQYMSLIGFVFFLPVLGIRALVRGQVR